MSKATATRARPLSPHLTAYKWPVTMTMSILHRITGGALYFGTLLVAWWLIAAATSETLFRLRQRHFRLVVRAAGSVRLHLGAAPSYARRRPPPDLGYRRRAWKSTPHRSSPGRRRRLGRADDRCLDRRLRRAGDVLPMADMRTPLSKGPRPRLGAERHRAFLAHPADLGRATAAVAVLPRLGAFAASAQVYADSASALRPIRSSRCCSC